MYQEKITYEELLEIKRNLIKKYDDLMMKYYQLYKKAKEDKKENEALAWFYSWAFEDGRLKGFCDFINAVYDYLVKKNDAQN